MNMKKNIIAVTLIVAGVFPLKGQTQELWTLRQCVEYAIANNIAIRQTANTVIQNETELNTSKWTRLPNLNGSANQNFSWGRAASPIDNTYTDTNNSNTSFSLSTNVPLFTGFQIPNQYELNKLNLKVAIEDLNKAKDDIALNVASFYVQVLFNQELSKVADNQVSLSREQLNRMVQLSELGKASPAQVAEAKARLAQDELSAVQADNNYRLALLDLSQLLELSSPEGFTLAPPDAELEFAPLIAPDDIYEQAALSKPAILAAQYRLEGSEKSIRIAQSGYYPQLSFSAGLGTSFYTMNGISGSSFGSQMENNLNRYLGFNLSVPIFNRFSTRNRVRLAQLQQTQYSLQMDNVKKNTAKLENLLLIGYSPAKVAFPYQVLTGGLNLVVVVFAVVLVSVLRNSYTGVLASFIPQWEIGSLLPAAI
ncbi:hypothetical protein EZS27_023490, partial [termite gut metagenome]